jgi:NAD(P)-dependent dehydrogenase (short-subunit alcohol dehydrogenase family)
VPANAAPPVCVKLTAGVTTTTDRQGQVALVTGCSSGIGRATALRLARDGHVVYATARSVESLADLEAAGCTTLALDVTSKESRQAAVREVEARHGAVGVLVNNAGYSQSGALETLPLELLRKQLETNVAGLLGMCQLVLPAMRAQGRGRIVNISSMGGRLSFPGGGAYHASKYAVEALSDVLRFEVAGFGVDVILVQPGIIRTGFADAAVEAIPETDDDYGTFNTRVAQATRSVYERGLLARLGGSPDDVAAVIARAVDATRPRTRYPVTPSARLMMTLRRVLPDRAWDRLVAGSFPRPSGSSG